MYVTDVEHSTIHRRAADGTWHVVVRDANLPWPDTMALMADGTLRQRPFVLFRIPTSSRPVMR